MNVSFLKQKGQTFLFSSFANVKMLFFFVLCDSKHNIFAFQAVGWLKQVIWRLHIGLIFN